MRTTGFLSIFFATVFTVGISACNRATDPTFLADSSRSGLIFSVTELGKSPNPGLERSRGLRRSFPKGPVIALQVDPRTFVCDFNVSCPCLYPTFAWKCQDFVTTGRVREFPGRNIYVFASNIAPENGVSVLSLSIEYEGESGIGIDPRFVSWWTCADNEAPIDGENGPWPASGSSNVITWDTCQRNVFGAHGVQAVAGWFYMYVYSESRFEIRPNRNAGPAPELSVTDCEGRKYRLPRHAAGYVDFGGGQGYNPCKEWALPDKAF